MFNTKFNIPIAIILSAVVLGVSYYAVQYTKQRSIEKQQLIELGAENKKEIIKQKFEREKEIFDRKIECREIYNDLKKSFYNVAGVSYSLIQNTCMVSYYDTGTGELEKVKIENFVENK